jgi:hypothetical protein
MVEFAIVALIVAIIGISVVIRRTRTGWPGNLHRLHAGVHNKAEWMAPDDIIHNVEMDYLSAHRWMAEALSTGYIRFLREAPLYFTGNYLKTQLHNANTQLRKRGPRLLGILQAHHYIHVRHFSDDGLSCYVVDHQTRRRMITFDYWKMRKLHSQDLGEGVYVYRMIYIRAEKRWKIEELIQQLPMGWGMQMSGATIRLDESLPHYKGRDI